VPSFSFQIEEIVSARQSAMRGRSWHQGMGCPEFGSLVALSLSHWDFEGRVVRGELEVAREIATELVDIFEALFRLRFAIARMRAMHHYDGDDDRSMADNNTSAFNCRNKVGKRELSVHSCGRAIDINPVQNPYQTARGLVLPPNGTAFARRDGRAVDGPGVISADGPVVRAFEAHGFSWGGRWSDPVDFQHFEKP
jgi:hypothetical protein